MGKMKQLCLEHVGYKIEGKVFIILWGGQEASIEMKPFYITADKLTHTAIKDGINDGGMGCQAITEANLRVYDVYGSQKYSQLNRKLILNSKQCFKALRGIKQV